MAQVDWAASEAQQFAGAERLWRFHVARGWRRKAASPLRWSFVEYARTTLQTGLRWPLETELPTVATRPHARSHHSAA